MNAGQRELELAGRFPPPPDSIYYATPKDIDDACARWYREIRASTYIPVGEREPTLAEKIQEADRNDD